MFAREFVYLLLTVFVSCALPAGADMASLAGQQAKEKEVLEDMKRDIDDIKSTMSETTQEMEQIAVQLSTNKQAKEFHLLARQGRWELLPGIFATGLMYNGQVPGPVIRVEQGDLVRIVLHNQLPVPTSLYFQGLALPASVNGLPSKLKGLVGPGETYAYEFVASQAGTVWYHPQTMHLEQMYAGLAGVLVIEPHARLYNKDYVLVVGEFSAAKEHVASPAVTYFCMNGKSAPAVPPIEVRKGDRVHLRVVNAAKHPCPLFLSGHKFDVLAVNGGDVENQSRDVVTIMPGERYDLEFLADNPGVWTLSSLLVEESTNQGHFPGGIACIVRY